MTETTDAAKSTNEKTGNKSDDKSDFEITSEKTLIGDLVSLLVQEVKALQEPWQALSQIAQQEALDRMQAGVTDAVEKAMRFLAVEGCDALSAEVEQVVFKDGCKAVLKPSIDGGLRHELADHVGRRVLIVFPDTQKLGDEGMPTPAPDQQELTIEEDPLLDEAIQAVRATNKTSISFVQRELRMSYTRAARMVERMEQLGIVTELQQNGMREVIEQDNANNQAA